MSIATDRDSALSGVPVSNTDIRTLPDAATYRQHVDDQTHTIESRRKGSMLVIAARNHHGFDKDMFVSGVLDRRHYTIVLGHNGHRKRHCFASAHFKPAEEVQATIRHNDHKKLGKSLGGSGPLFGSEPLRGDRADARPPGEDAAGDQSSDEGPSAGAGSQLRSRVAPPRDCASDIVDEADLIQALDIPVDVEAVRLNDEAQVKQPDQVPAWRKTKNGPLNKSEPLGVGPADDPPTCAGLSAGFPAGGQLRQDVDPARSHALPIAGSRDMVKALHARKNNGPLFGAGRWLRI